MAFLLIFLAYISSAHTDDDTFSSYISHSTLAKMPYPLSHATAVLFKAVERVEDPTTNVDFSWEVVPEDRVYFFGGCTSGQTCTTSSGGARTCTCASVTNRCVYYRPITNTWGTCASAPIARHRHAWAKAYGKVYLFGGQRADGSIVKQVDVYDVLSNKWDTAGIQWPNATTDAIAWGVDEARSVYVAGGFNQNKVASNAVTRFDIVSKKAARDTPNMLHARGAGQVLQVGNLFYVMGGYDAAVGVTTTGACSQPVHWAEAYDSLHNRWVQLPDQLYGRASLAMGTNYKNLVFAIAGETVDPADPTCTSVVPVPNVGLFNSSSNTWTTVDSLPTSNRFRYISSPYYNASFRGIYLFGGTSVFDPTCGCPPGQSVGCGAGCYHASNVTTLYVPVSLNNHHPRPPRDPPLSPGAIAGVVIAGIVVATLLGTAVFAIASRYAYRYFVVRDVDDGDPTKGGAAYNIDDVEDNKAPAPIAKVAEVRPSDAVN
jgi:hypothetical protein